MKENIATRLKFKNIDKEVVIKIIDKLNSKSNYGFDGISTKLLKQIKLIIVEPLTVIINQMLNTGIFQDLLQIAQVIPIYKKKKTMKQISQITDQYLYYLQYQKYLKR